MTSRPRRTTASPQAHSLKILLVALTILGGIILGTLLEYAIAHATTATTARGPGRTPDARDFRVRHQHRDRAVASGGHAHGEDDIRYVRRRYLTPQVATDIANATFTARHREVMGNSGAKSDKADAHALADMVRTRRHQLRQVAADSEAAEAVKVVARAHQSLIWERTRHMLRLRAALRDYFPAALAAYQSLGLASPAVLALLAKAPDPRVSEADPRPDFRRAQGPSGQAGQGRGHPRPVACRALGPGAAGQLRLRRHGAGHCRRPANAQR
ncbi:IS110 family transposase [Nonomuraea jabiensis]|uniref:IS110 family transposase n=1 Tax=Nonomuraea jabiensis TaxID=882448 RepID=UPI003D712402